MNEIERMFHDWWNSSESRMYHGTFRDRMQQAFTAGVRAENEACAKICNEQAKNFPAPQQASVANHCAIAIRSRYDEETPRTDWRCPRCLEHLDIQRINDPRGYDPTEWVIRCRDETCHYLKRVPLSQLRIERLDKVRP